MAEDTSTSWAVWLLGFFALLATTAMGAWMSRVIDRVERAQDDIVQLQRDMDVVKQKFAVIDGRLVEIQSGIGTILHALTKGRPAH